MESRGFLGFGTDLFRRCNEYVLFRCGTVPILSVGDHASVHVPEIEPSSVRTERYSGGSSVTASCRLTQAMKRRADYALVPFEVVSGTARLEVEYAYDERDGKNQIDLGLVDPRGPAFPEFQGFRGWSGAARRRAVVTEATATPGYLPGPIEPGRWWVLLGLYKVASEGVEVRLSITTASAAGESPAAPLRASAEREEPRGDWRWFRGDLHSHTDHSDAAGSLEDLVAAARRQGLDFLAVTDHNTTSHFAYLGAGDDRDDRAQHGIALLPGEEVTTYYGHMNVWGNQSPLDFRVRDAADIRAVIDAARAQNAIVSASHPTIGGMQWTFGYELPLDCLEVWHGRAGPLNSVTLEIWDGMLDAGRRVVAVGGSDVHIGNPQTPLPGEPTTWIRARSATRAELLDGLRHGRVTITAHDGPWLELLASDGSRTWHVGDIAPAGELMLRCTVSHGTGSTLRLLSADRELATEVVGQDPFELELALDLSDARLVRAELHKRGNPSWEEAFPLLGMTNPIWCE